LKKTHTKLDSEFSRKQDDYETLNGDISILTQLKERMETDFEITLELKEKEVNTLKTKLKKAELDCKMALKQSTASNSYHKRVKSPLLVPQNEIVNEESSDSDQEDHQPIEDGEGLEEFEGSFMDTMEDCDTGIIESRDIEIDENNQIFSLNDSGAGFMEDKDAETQTDEVNIIPKINLKNNMNM
jgi:hypothetical protein